MNTSVSKSKTSRDGKRLLQLNISKKLSDKLSQFAEIYDINKSSLTRFLLMKGLKSLEQQEMHNNNFTGEEEMEIIKRSEEIKQGKNISPAFPSMDEAITYLQSKE